uniref:Uncharacterized protein n=1 Tax=Amphiprion ocellaris TaxID=80972 RepID=A0AAQ6A3L2_AMPOC
MRVEENPPPPPILLSRSDHSLTFAPAPYNLAEKVCWYQLCGRVAEGLNWKVRLGDFSLPGTGKMVAFQTEQYTIAKRACRELWSHYTYPDCGSQSTDDRFAATELRKQALHCSSPHLCQLFLISIFIETEINIQQGSLYSDSFSDNGPFIWEQEARLAECERMLVAMDLAMCLNDDSGAVQAVVSCYGLLAPLIFHQITCDPVVK